MKALRDVVPWLQGASADELSMKTVCVREPWTPLAEVRVVQLDEASRLPTGVLEEGHKYFLEASVAREVLDALRGRPTKSSIEDACKLLIYYAENDAYPDWIYD